MSDRDWVERFWRKVERTDGCWLWRGYVAKHGYGQFSPVQGTTIRAHRFSYELAKGKVPDGLVLDHLCRVPHCVNPEHLEAVTQRENVRRSCGITAELAKRTHCNRGHEYTPENTRFRTDGSRKCRECVRYESAVQNAKRRGHELRYRAS